MIHSARLKLTLWYTLIIMTVSVLFSVAVYQTQFTELQRSLQEQQQRFSRLPRFNEPILNSPDFENQLLSESSNRLLLSLLLINLGILGVGGSAAYILAGRTLKPLEESLAEQKRFIADASHELRTPLTAMRTETEVAVREKGLQARAKQVLTSNLEEIIYLQTLTDQLLHLSRLEGPSPLNLEKISIKEVLDSSISKITPQAKSKSIQIKANLKDHSVEADRMQIGELFTIILDNAVKYSEKGQAIEVSSKLGQNRVRVEIEDHGIGIKASEVTHIFSRFYRADSSRTKQQIDGFGLGLPIAKAIADKHQSTISVESHLGSGTKVIVMIPFKHSHRPTPF